MSASKTAYLDDISHLRRANEWVLNHLESLEPADNEVLSETQSQTKVIYENHDFSMASTHTTPLIGLRTMFDKKMGFATANSLTEADLKQVAHEAQLVARLCVPNPHFSLAQPGHHEAKVESLWDAELADIQPEQLFSIAEKAVIECCKDPRVVIERLEVDLCRNCWALNNSLGVSQAAAQCALTWSVMGVAKEGDEVSSFDFDGTTVASLKNLDSEIQRSLGEFRRSVLRGLHTQKGESYKGAVLLHPYSVLELFGELISDNCNGQRHQDGMSSWKGLIGSQVASTLLSVFEDPHNRSRASGWMPFDREGHPTHARELISQGQLKFIAHNQFSAMRAGTQSTGNAIGGARSVPKIGFHNLTFSGGTTGLTESQITKNFGSGLVLKRFSGNLDTTSGEFSGVAKNSWWVKNGTPVYPVSEVMISGNLFECLRQIREVGSEVVMNMEGAGAPYMIVEGFHVTSSK